MPGVPPRSPSPQLVKQNKWAELEEGRRGKNKKVIRKLQQRITSSSCVFNSELLFIPKNVLEQPKGCWNSPADTTDVTQTLPTRCCASCELSKLEAA